MEEAAATQQGEEADEGGEGEQHWDGAEWDGWNGEEWNEEEWEEGWDDGAMKKSQSRVDAVPQWMKAAVALDESEQRPIEVWHLSPPPSTLARTDAHITCARNAATSNPS